MKWYHVTMSDRGNEFLATPKIPEKSRLKGEDRTTPRVSVAFDWKSPIHMLCCIRQSQIYHVYITEEEPVNPVELRKQALAEKKIRKNSNVFKCPDAEINKERWFLKPVLFKHIGHVDIGKSNYTGLLMSFGMGASIDFDKVIFKEGKPKVLSMEERLKELRDRGIKL